MCQASSTAVARPPNNWEIAGRCLHVVQHRAIAGTPSTTAGQPRLTNHRAVQNL